MKTFNDAFKTVIEHEGYYANVIGDRGGETYMGIARVIHPTWDGWAIIDGYKNNYGEIKRNQKLDIIVLDSMVEKFYFQKYWVGNGIHLIENYNLQYIIFDWCVNSGRFGAKKVQRIVGAKPDGIIGKFTALLINHFNPLELFNTIKSARINYYHVISEKGQNIKFLKGWLKRINSINYE